MNTKPTADGTLLSPPPCSASFTEGPWRYQKETTVSILGEKVPPRVRYQVYKDGGIYGHPATCDREEDARLIAASPRLLNALRPFANYACELADGETCDCHNCEARAAIREALGQNDQGMGRRGAAPTSSGS